MTQSTQTQQSQSQSAPWAPTQGLLQNYLNSLGTLNTAPTIGQNSAINNLSQASSGLPNFGSQAAGAAGGLLGGVPSNLNQTLSGNLGAITNTLSPYMSSSYTNPTTNPQIQQMLQTIQQQTTNAVNSQAAGMGRSGSGDNTEALALGLSQGEAPALLNQYNQNVAAQQGAAGQLLNAGTGTAGAILNNATGGANLAAAQPGLAQNPALAQLGAAQTAFGLPFSNLGTAEGLTLPIAGLGQQTSGTATTQYDPSVLSMLQSMFIGGGQSAASGLGSAVQGGLGFLKGLPSFFAGGV